jgi:hypothetical protein
VPLNNCNTELASVSGVGREAVSKYRFLSVTKFKVSFISPCTNLTNGSSIPTKIILLLELGSS